MSYDETNHQITLSETLITMPESLPTEKRKKESQAPKTQEELKKTLARKMTPEQYDASLEKKIDKVRQDLAKAKETMDAKSLEYDAAKYNNSPDIGNIFADFETAQEEHAKLTELLALKIQNKQEAKARYERDRALLEVKSNSRVSYSALSSSMMHVMMMMIMFLMMFVMMS